jgi:capsid protein
VQDVQAKKAEIRSGLVSRAQKITEEGYDIDEVDREIAEGNARADELGLVFDSDPRRTADNGAEQALMPGGEADAGDGDESQPQPGAP